VVFAALFPGDTVILPSVTVKTPSRFIVAQAGETAREGEDKDKEKKSRDTTWYWVGGSVLAAAIAAGIIIGLSQKHGHKEECWPICP